MLAIRPNLLVIVTPRKPVCGVTLIPLSNDPFRQLKFAAKDHGYRNSEETLNELRGFGV
jgi:hypothetical protein